MKLGVVGGGLRGLEMVYLARKAGIRTIVIDKVDGTPACSLADEVHICDLDTEKEIVKELLFACDAVIPAIEDEDACAMLEAMMHGSGIPLIYDRRTAHIGRSKVLSFKLMRSLGIPIPTSYPECDFPALVTPSKRGQDPGFTRVDDRKQLEKKIKNVHKSDTGTIVQELLTGPSVTIDVIGNADDSRSLVYTHVIRDENYERKFLFCSPDLNDTNESSMRDHAVRLANELHLHGIVSLDAIVDREVTKIIDMEPMFPLGTPLIDLHSKGLNDLEMLIQLYTTGDLDLPILSSGRAVSLEHIIVERGKLRSVPEKKMASSTDLRIAEGLFGSDEMITDFQEGKDRWAATVICCGDTFEEARSKRMRCMASIVQEEGLNAFLDPALEVNDP